MEPGADGHRQPAAVGEHHLDLHTGGRESVDHLALELVGEVAEDGVVAGVRVVAALDKHLVVMLPGLRHDERLALEDAVVVVVFALDGDREAVFPAVEAVTPVADAVGREEQRHAEDLRPPEEGLDLVGRGGPQDLRPESRVGQPHEVGTLPGNDERRVVPKRELHGAQSVKIDAA